MSDNKNNEKKNSSLPAKKEPFKLSPLFIEEILHIIHTANQKAFTKMISAMVYAYWEMGHRIVIEQQAGHNRAEYGTHLLKELAKVLSKDLGKKFDARELRRIRQLYLYFPDRDSLRPEATWSHYRLLLRIENKEVRMFYLEESISGHWSTRKLERNISSQYYHRMLSNQVPSKDELAPPDLSRLASIKNPYVFEFLKLPPNLAYKEKDIENKLIQELPNLLLELGREFSFVAQQKLIRTPTSNYYLDLVFYNFHLKSFLIVEIKKNSITHQDIGQLDMYVRMFDELEKSPTDNPTMGLLLCADIDDMVIKFSALRDRKNLFASKYQMYMPSQEELDQFTERSPEYAITRKSSLPSEYPMLMFSLEDLEQFIGSSFEEEFSWLFGFLETDLEG